MEAMPLPNPENTGKPSAPKSRYTPTAAHAVAPSSTAGNSANAMVCKVKGTDPSGMLTQEATVRSATNTPARAI